MGMKRELYYGDNLEILREHIPDESVDLIYLDPPFNSSRDYNLLFKSPSGQTAEAQITAFEDTWHWGDQAEREYKELLHQSNTDVAELMRALRSFLKENDLMAYLTMMANRLLELHRVMNSTGSIYLHCDPTASHYLKIVMDGVFGKEFFINEVVWKRTNVHSDSKSWSATADYLLFYSRSNQFTWNSLYQPHTEDYINERYKFDDNDGRGLYMLDNMTSPNPRPNMMYNWKGFPFPDKGWRFEKSRMETLDNDGRIYYPTNEIGGYEFSKRPRLKRYLNEMKGRIFDTIWTDIPPINSQAAERLGYPTQKPLTLLERIIQASSNPGDIVLDPFCGCGTAVHAAEKLGRNWIGIDITHLAVALIEKRMNDAYPGIEYEVHGVPKDFGSAGDLAKRDKYEFQYWACSLVNARPYQGKKKGADTGIDGIDFFQDDNKPAKKVIVSVKGGDNVGVGMIRELISVVNRERAEIGLFVTLTPPTGPMVKEAAAAGFYHSQAYNQDWPRIQILTVEGLLSDKDKPQFINVNPDLTFKSAKRESKSGEQQEIPL